MKFQSKYKNKPCIVKGIRFPSIKEGNYYNDLCIKKEQGLIKDFRRQVRFGLGAVNEHGREYCHLVDFEITLLDGRKRYVETKGLDLPLGRLKRHMVEYAHGIKIEVV